jgi:hypothetical protein
MSSFTFVVNRFPLRPPGACSSVWLVRAVSNFYHFGISSGVRVSNTFGEKENTYDDLASSGMTGN